MKVCTFVGLGLVKDKEKVKKEVKQHLIKLLSEGITTFLFGGGEFVDLCYSVVTELKDTYAYIERIFYPCGNENFYFNTEDGNNKCYKQKVFEKVEHINFGSIEPEKLRDKRLVDECDVCVLYLLGSYINKTDDIFDYTPSYKIEPKFNIKPKKRAIIIKV